MGIIEERDKRTGKRHIVVSRRWPDGSRFRRRCPNRTTAKNLLWRVNESIAMGTWRELRKELRRGIEPEYTVRTFWERFRDEYCKPRMASWRRYELSFRTLNERLGDIPLREFRRRHLHGYVERRVHEVAPNTVNRDIAACKKMFSYALEVGAVDAHPLVKFPTIKVQQKALRLPTLEEFRRLVDHMEDPELAAMVAIMGETGIRKSEALELKRSQVDFKGKRLVIEKTKSKKVRYVPLSDYALEKIRGLVQFINQPYLIVHQHNGQRWTNPDKKFRAARKAAGLEWVTFHTLRHLRGTAWIEHGVDLLDVKEALGHSDIRTTMRYLHHVESRAERSIREAQKREARELRNASKRATNGRHES